MIVNFCADYFGWNELAAFAAFYDAMHNFLDEMQFLGGFCCAKIHNFRV